MTKTKLILLATVFVAMSITFGSENNQPFAIASFIGWIICIAWYAVKAKRDHSILEQARQEREAAAQVITSPPQTSKGTHGVFVPSPLQERGEE